MENPQRRKFLKIIPLAATYFAGIGTVITHDRVVKMLSSYDEAQLPDIDIKKIVHPQLLFGDGGSACIVPGNTNKLLLTKTKGNPQMSEYVRAANDKSRTLFKAIHKNLEIDVLDYSDPKLRLDKYKNMLILGGPIASELTMTLCGYQNNDIIGEEADKTPGKIPVFTKNISYPAYFYVGDEIKGYNVIEAKRPDPNGKPLVSKDGKPIGTYTIFHKEKELVPIITNGILRTDMLMVIRIPNPIFPLEGYITIIGGMHGYSLRAFFESDAFYDNLAKLDVFSEGMSCFQMLIPAAINDNGKAILKWDNAPKDWGDWRLYVDELDPIMLSDIIIDQ